MPNSVWNSLPQVTKQLPVYTQKNSKMMTAATVDRMFFLSWKRLEKNAGMVMACTRSEYWRRRLATNSQFRYVPIARPIQVHMASEAPKK